VGVVSRVVQVERGSYERRYEWVAKRGGWQLPCGCIGPDFWSCEEKGECVCAGCRRGWMPMDKSGGQMCKMLDGGKQGPPVLVLGKNFEVKSREEKPCV
jgi:hypothetical protein